MEYKVVLTSVAKIQFRHIIDYLLYELEKQQAAVNVINDFDGYPAFSCGRRPEAVR